MGEPNGCPFCGGQPSLRVPSEDDGFAVHVSCRCGAQLFGHRRHFASGADAIAAWNRRASPEVSEAEVERALTAFWAFIDKHGAGTGGDGPAMRAALTAARGERT